MAIETLTAVPSEFYAGDTVKILLPAGSYPAPDWTRKLSFNGPEQFAVTAADSGTGHLFTITSPLTASKTAGVYAWTEIAESEGERATVNYGNVWVKPNPTIGVTTWAQECLTLLRAHIKGRLPAGLTSHAINGTSISKMSLPEAVKLEAYYAARVAAEEASKLNSGNDAGTIRIYFDR